MEEYIEVSAKTKEEAIMNAAIQLGTSSDNIEYDVIQEGHYKGKKEKRYFS